VKTDKRLIPEAGDRDAISAALEACGSTDHRRTPHWSLTETEIDFTCLECGTPDKASMNVKTTQWQCWACRAKGNLRTLRVSAGLIPATSNRPKPTRALASRGSYSAIEDQIAFALKMIECHAMTTEIVRELMRVKGISRATAFRRIEAARGNATGSRTKRAANRVKRRRA
jgi:hypothetical protein